MSTTVQELIYLMLNKYNINFCTYNFSCIICTKYEFCFTQVDQFRSWTKVYWQHLKFLLSNITIPDYSDYTLKLYYSNLSFYLLTKKSTLTLFFFTMMRTTFLFYSIMYWHKLHVLQLCCVFLYHTFMIKLNNIYWRKSHLYNWIEIFLHTTGIFKYSYSDFSLFW